MAYETEYVQHTLPNGLRVVVASRPWSRTFAATLALRVGWRDETLDQAGIVHLLEHLAFRGANLALSERLGRQGLYLNAQAAYEQTTFIVSGHGSLIADGLEFLGNVLKSVPSDAATLAEETEILAHEMAAGEETTADAEMRKLTARIIGDKNFGRPVLATLKGLRSITPAQLDDFHRAWFAPSNACLTLVVPVPPAEAVAMAERALGPIADRPAQRPARGADVPELPPLIRIAGGGAYVLVLVLHPFRPASRFPVPATIMLSDLLGGGPHSELFRRVRQEARLAYAVGSNVTFMSDCGILDVFATVRKGDVCRALEVILDSLGQLAAKGLDAQVFEEARQRLLRSLDSFEDNPLELCNFLAYSPEQELTLKTPQHYRADLEKFTRDDASRIAADLLKPTGRVCVLMGPAGWLTGWRVKRLLAEKKN
jgi:predicted Zn-dependent peptidase